MSHALKILRKEKARLSKRVRVKKAQLKRDMTILSPEQVDRRSRKIDALMSQLSDIEQALEE